MAACTIFTEPRHMCRLNLVDLLVVYLIAIGTASQTGLLAQQVVDFNLDIRPLLSDRCFVCHGPDEQANQSGLRLDNAELAKAAGVWVAGDPDNSELMDRITSSDMEARMPPPDSHLKLSAAEIERFRSWIQQGANYDTHWSFKRLPLSIDVPLVTRKDWIRNGVDAFVLRKLQHERLQPAPESARWRWLRRVTFDLTGLPPSAGEIEAFESDVSDNAYETVVDRLLSSGHYGQHLATHWLDLVRYADSYGYQSDLLCTTWPYRDWVVRAINENLPYDQFLVWQLAGDLVPNSNQDQKLATAFNRLHRQTNEGGSVALEWQTEYIADRVNTFGTAMLGMTLECTRCHDHKFDPISQQDSLLRIMVAKKI